MVRCINNLIVNDEPEGMMMTFVLPTANNTGRK